MCVGLRSGGGLRRRRLCSGGRLQSETHLQPAVDISIEVPVLDAPGEDVEGLTDLVELPIADRWLAQAEFLQELPGQNRDRTFKLRPPHEGQEPLDMDAPPLELLPLNGTRWWVQSRRIQAGSGDENARR